MFTFDNKEYDETKLNQQGQEAYGHLKLIANQELDLQVKANHIAVLKAHYTNILKENLPTVEEKKEEPEEEKKE
jgi:outer membrane protein assembly factor BamE (lipoprotein component of BamABCDE complex)